MNDHKATVQLTVEHSCGDHDDDVYLDFCMQIACQTKGNSITCCYHSLHHCSQH